MHYKPLLFSAIIGTTIFFSVLLIASQQYEGFNHITGYTSELGAIHSPVKNLMNYGGFLPGGIFIILFAIGIHHTNIENKTSGKIATYFIFLMGIQILLLTIFPCQEQCGGQHLFSGPHEFFAGSALTAGLLALLFFSYYVYKHHPIKEYKLWSEILLIGGTSAIIIGIFYSQVEPTYSGLLQKIMFSIPLITMSILSIKLYKSKKIKEQYIKRTKPYKK